MRKRAKAGDIFTQELDNGKFMFGRVLMDIQEQCFKSKIIVDKAASRITNFEVSYVIEIYKTISKNNDCPEDPEIIIHGIVMDQSAFSQEIWKIIGFKEVDPKEVDFQESLSYYNGILDFHRGEVFISTKVPEEFITNKIEEFDPSAFANSFWVFSDVLDYIENGELAQLLDCDKRLLPKEVRDTVYKIIDEDPEMSYYDLAMKHGFDTARFFN